ITVPSNDTSSIQVVGPTFRPFHMKLPAAVPVGTVTLPTDMGVDVEKDMVLKLPIAKGSEISLAPIRTEITAPWSASDLSSSNEVSIYCANCNATLVAN